MALKGSAVARPSFCFRHPARGAVWSRLVEILIPGSRFLVLGYEDRLTPVVDASLSNLSIAALSVCHSALELKIGSFIT